MSNIVFIATSIDGYIADRNGGLEWLETVPNPDQKDLGWNPLMERIDAIVMGRRTFETVCGFDCDWPYPKPVFVLSNTLKKLPEEYADKAELVSGPLTDVVKNLHGKGYEQLYIDGGAAVQGFLKEDMIDELIITVIPILLGGGTQLFGELPEHMEFEHVSAEIMLGALVQNHYRRKR